MRSDDFEKVLSDIDEKYLNELDEARNAVMDGADSNAPDSDAHDSNEHDSETPVMPITAGRKNRKKNSTNRIRTWGRFAAAAASLALVFTIGYSMPHNYNYGGGAASDSSYSTGYGGGWGMKGDAAAPEAPAEMAPDMEMAGDYNAEAQEAGGGMEYQKPMQGSVTNDAAARKSDYSQKLVYTYDYAIETTAFDETIAQIQQKVDTCGGYIESSDLFAYGQRGSDMTIRIPEEQADSFLSAAESFGTITRRQSSASDITLKYYSVKDRLESLETQRQRLLELMNKAESLTDIAQLSQQISDLEYEINNYQTNLRIMDNRVDYVTINMSVNEVTLPSVQEADSFLTRIQKGLSSNTADLINGATYCIICAITSLPYLLAFGVILTVVVLIVRKLNKK